MGGIPRIHSTWQLRTENLFQREQRADLDVAERNDITVILKSNVTRFRGCEIAESRKLGF